MSTLPKHADLTQQHPLYKQSFWATVWDWMTTVDHKKIGIMYIASGLFYLFVGGIEALLIRLQLIGPNQDFVGPDTFNQLFTTHGTTMIFFVAMPILIGFMNYIMPLQIGARDVAFPAMNAFSFWLFFVGALIFNISWFAGGAPDGGWFAYAPVTLDQYSPGPGMDFYDIGLQISGFGTIMGAINFIVTIVNMRAPGMTYLRMPLFTWTTFVTSALILFAFPPLTINLFLLMFDRLFDANFFNVGEGGNVLIWQHLFWLFGHPEVYIVILPAFGIMSEVFATFSKKRLFGYSAMVFSTVVIGFLGYMVWVHHMFTDGLGPLVNAIFSVSSMLIAIPTGIKIFNWLFTMWGGRIQFTTAMLYAVGFIPTFVMGGVTGVMVATAPADYQYHDSYFVVAHFHYVLIGGTVFAIMAALYYWYPRMFNRMLDERLGKWNFWLTFIGFHMIFFPQHFLGLMGMPRRVFTYQEGMGLEFWNLVSTIGAFVFAVGVLILVYNIVLTARKGKPAPHDPWDGRTLEWALPNPTPVYNFAQTPLVKGLDSFWLEKQAGKSQVTAAEPMGPIHMPSNSYLPILQSVVFMIAGLAAIYRSFGVALLAMVVFTGIFLAYILEEDEGYHIDPRDPDSGNEGGEEAHG